MSVLRVFLIAGVVCLGFAPAALAYDFVPYQHFPGQAPGPFGFPLGFRGVGLPGGHLLVWNGAALYLQSMRGADGFEFVMGGADGDPGFMTLTPDKSALILGEGFGGRIYRISVGQLRQLAAPEVVATQSHYSGAMLTNQLVLLDAGKSDFSGSELLVLDLGAAKSAPRTVLRLPPAPPTKDLVADKPPFAYSSSVCADYERGVMYVMDGNTRELRYFLIEALITAFNTSAVLDWAVDGTAIGAPGTFFTGGVTAVTRDGLLLIDGSAGFLAPGGIQLVNPRLDDPAQAKVLLTFDPLENQSYYTAIYNGETGAITAVAETGEAFTTDPKPGKVPVMGLVGRILMSVIIVLLARRRCAA